MTGKNKFILFLLFILQFLATPIYAANTGTIDITCNLPRYYNTVQLEVYFYDSDGKIIDQQFPYISNSKPGELKSGDSVKLNGAGRLLEITDLPIGTRYRIRCIEYKEQLRCEQIEFTGTIEGPEPVNINYEFSENDSYFIYPLFKTEILNPDLTNQEFKYEISLVDDNDAQNVIIHENPITTNGPGTSVIPVELKNPGTYRLKVKQINDGNGSLKLDDREYVIELTASFSYDYENYQQTITYYLNDQPIDIPVFENDKIELDPVEYAPKVQKVLNGTEANRQDFTFVIKELEDQDGVEMPDETTLKLNAGSSDTFSPITFNALGTYKFEIAEKKSNIFGYTYDENKWNLTVDVGSEGNALVINKVSYSNDLSSDQQEATFNNTYDSGNLKITKQVTGKEDESRKFNFKISLTDSEDKALEGEYPTDKENQKISNGSSFTLGKDESLTIISLPAGAKYSITEENIPNGYSIDPNPMEGTIKGSDETVEVIANNIYSQTPVTYSPVVEKVLEGLEESAEVFEFTIESSDSNITLPSNLSITGKGTGNFEPITFTKDGVYNFTIKEIGKDTYGYSYDNSIWNLKVTVTDFDSILTIANVEYSKDQETNDQKATFINTYNPDPTTINIQVNKSISGNAPLDQQEFTFNLTADSDNPVGDDFGGNEEKSIENIAQSPISFSNINYSKPGTYKYHITEKQEDRFGFTFDTNEWICEVNVSDNLGKLEASSKYYILGHEEESNETYAQFTNIYNSGNLKITKTTVNEPSETSFTFRIRLLDDKENPLTSTYPVEITNSSIESISDNGTFELKNNESIVIKDLPEGTKYTVTEENLPAGYTNRFDSSIGTIQKNNTIELNCINTYIPKEIDFAPNITKTLNGEVQEDKTFNFTVSPISREPEDGDNIETELKGSKTGSGKVEISNITYSKPGTYIYSIKEDVDTIKGYSFDTREYRLEVIVTDIGGQLEITNSKYTLAESDDPLEGAEFINTYNPLLVTYSPKVIKTVSGNPVFDSIFTFSLEAADQLVEGFTLPENTTTQITGSNETTFSAITFTKKGNYSFYIKEINENLPGYIYDDSIWQLDIKVIDNEGQLEIEEAQYSVIDYLNPKENEVESENNSEILQEEAPEEENFELEHIDTSVIETTVLENKGVSINEDLISKDSLENKNVTRTILNKVYYSAPERAAPIKLASKGLDQEANFNNEFKMANIIIHKKVFSSPKTNDLFKIKVEFDDESQPDHYYQLGESAITRIPDDGILVIHQDEELIIYNIPVGTFYNISEILEDDKYSALSLEYAGFITSTENLELTFYNQANLKTGDLLISKILDSDKEINEAFEFTFYTSDEDKNSYYFKGTDEGLIKSGETFNLKAGEKILIKGIPIEMNYKVEEINNSNYSVTSQNNTGEIKEGQTEVVFTNTPKSLLDKLADVVTPKTGDDFNILGPILIIGLINLLIVISIIIPIKKRKGKNYRNNKN